MQGLMRMLMMYYMFKMFTGGNKNAATGPDGKAQMLSPLLPRGHPLDMHLFISEKRDWRTAAAAEQPVWTASNVPLGEAGTARGGSYIYRPSPAVQNNGSVWVHAVFTPSGASPNPKDEFFDRTASFARTSQLNAYLKKRAAKAGVNLLSGKNSTDGEALPDDVALKNETVIISYLKPNVTVQMIDDFSRYNAAQVPPQYKDVIQVDPATMTYSPHVWFNTFWLLRDDLVPVNSSLSELTLHFELSTTPAWKHLVMSQLEQSFSMQRSMGAMADGDSDDVKRIFIESNPFLCSWPSPWQSPCCTRCSTCWLSRTTLGSGSPTSQCAACRRAPS